MRAVYYFSSRSYVLDLEKEELSMVRRKTLHTPLLNEQGVQLGGNVALGKRWLQFAPVRVHALGSTSTFSVWPEVIEELQHLGHYHRRYNDGESLELYVNR
jgi:hypothetical protein